MGTSNITPGLRPNFLLLLLRGNHLLVGFSLGIRSFFFIGSEMKAADASVTYANQLLGTAAAAGAYIAIGVLAIWDFRACSLFSITVSLLSTPVWALLWVFGQWTVKSSGAAQPLLWYLAGNAALIISSCAAMLILIRQRAWFTTK